ncbi:hypothetical protein GRF29_19g2353450 [Pseudopithomyces chartarum]|uniref:AAA+ ATPase domain-containing protein n=1 Tax=Pseudopithomyces chartarum TaxID=1892770 RepID=A0AAN6M5S8_9PLEO|nr:hypothetical protein GRF29_19g2353450 [Pseudopithomyces chartarum]
MYGALRSGLRASHRRPPARFISRRRYPSAIRSRAFHASRSLADHGSTPPQGPGSKDGAPSSNENEAVAGAAQPAAADAVEDADMLAQKLQRSREMTRRYSSALRRSQRKNRAQDLPPVTVPAWFLHECVRLSDEVSAAEPLRQLVLELRRRETDDSGTCSIPLHLPAAAAQLLSDFVFQAWGGAVSTEDKKAFAHQLAQSLATPDGEPQSATAESDKNQAADPAQTSDNRETRNTRPRGYVPPFVLAEIRAAIAASLSTLQPSPTDSFPATKTNLVLHCPSSGRDQELAHFLGDVAREQGADVITLHAQDLAEIAGDYLGDLPEPSPHSIRSLAYETYRLTSDLETESFVDEAGKDDLGDDQEDMPLPNSSFPSDFEKPGSPPAIKMPFSIVISKTFTNAFKAMQPPAQDAASDSDPQYRPQTQAENQLEDLKIANVLENLIDASDTKRNQTSPSASSTSSLLGKEKDASKGNSREPGFFSALMPSSPPTDKLDIDHALPSKALSQFALSAKLGSTLTDTNTKVEGDAKIIHVPDFKELNATHYGGRIIQKLEDIIRKRRAAGERIMIVGSTSSADLTPELSKAGVQSLQSEGEAGYYRTIVVPVEKVGSNSDFIGTLAMSPALSSREASKYRRVNIRHIFDMLRRLSPTAAQNLSARNSEDGSRAAAALGNISNLPLSRMLTYDEAHRIALTALGLHIMDSSNKHLNSVHVALAIGLLQVSDQVKFEHVRREVLLRGADLSASLRRRYEDSLRTSTKQDADPTKDRDRDLERKLQKVSTTATKHEKRLMPGIANPAQIKTTFEQIHVPADTVDSIRTLTSLSLLRPDAFNYGVLATEKISGALLYGPPGTGKTLLAKAVAKESGSTVLEVSGSQIMDKYVGEGEKNVSAIFSLARKLSPCIVFLDEADAIFSSRDVGRERASHRDILNQFLKEWDGLNDLSVFVMVATNRPFDLDDAVIRRLPRRLLVDLPTEKDRAAILKIHLRGEQLDESVNLDEIAKNTPFYSGSDLKNLAVSAALACVKEENEQAAITAAKQAASSPTPEHDGPTPSESSNSTTTDTKPPHLVRGLPYTFPEKRTLHKRHFDAALIEISASINEDMGSLNAIKKFDEKYGDKKGKKAKRVFGIGLDKGPNEDAARVRP